MSFWAIAARWIGPISMFVSYAPVLCAPTFANYCSKDAFAKRRVSRYQQHAISGSILIGLTFSSCSLTPATLDFISPNLPPANPPSRPPNMYPNIPSRICSTLGSPIRLSTLLPPLSQRANVVDRNAHYENRTDEFQTPTSRRVKRCAYRT